MKLLAMILASAFLSHTCGTSPMMYFYPPALSPVKPKDRSACVDPEGQELFSFQKSPCKKLNMTSKEPPSKMSLEEFFGKLKKFVNETNFDADGFAGQQETLEAEFSAITASSESGKSKKVFARRVFQTMIDAARCMAWYGSTSRPDHDLVYTAVELYVRALALHNIHGSPDVSMEDCKNRIKHLYQETRSLKSKLAMLSGPPVYVIVMLFDQIFRTTKTLKGLMAMLVEPEEAEFPC